MSRYTPPAASTGKHQNRTRNIPDGLHTFQQRPGWSAAVLAALVEVWPRTAPPFLKTQRACIFAARTAIDVCKVHEVQASPWPCAVWVGNTIAKQMLDDNIPVEAWPDAAYSVGAHPEMSAEVPVVGFAGHLVVEADGWLVDLTADQFRRRQHGINVDPLMIPVPDHGDMMQVTDGTWVRYQHRPELASWRKAVDWRNPCPAELHNLLCTQVADTLQAAVTDSSVVDTRTTRTSGDSGLAPMRGSHLDRQAF